MKTVRSLIFILFAIIASFLTESADCALEDGTFSYYAHCVIPSFDVTDDCAMLSPRVQTQQALDTLRKTTNNHNPEYEKMTPLRAVVSPAIRNCRNIDLYCVYRE